nr:MAG TPA: hypothetical protein [Caudoviricetes sp.]
MSVKSMLVDEFEKGMKEVSKIPIGSEEYAEAMATLMKLCDRINEIDKQEGEYYLNEVGQMNERLYKEQQLTIEKRTRTMEVACKVGLAVMQLLAAGLTFVMSTNFERNNTFTTEGGKISVRELLKFK